MCVYVKTVGYQEEINQYSKRFVMFQLTQLIDKKAIKNWLLINKERKEEEEKEKKERKKESKFFCDGGEGGEINSWL